MKVGGHFPKESDQDCLVIEKSFAPDLMNRFAIVLVCAMSFTNSDLAVFDPQFFLIVVDLVGLAFHMPEFVEIHWFELSIEDTDNLLLRKVGKSQRMGANLFRDLTFVCAVLLATTLAATQQTGLDST